MHYPEAYHMAGVNSWDSICRHGLLSTSGLLDLFEIAGEERSRLEAEHRPESVTITHPIHGRAVVRDQKPMREADLLKCLSDLTPQDWYRILNQRVFFWLSRERLHRLLNARAYRSRPHLVLTVDTSQLLARHSAEITLSPINSGCTLPAPQPRGADTFLSIAEYSFDLWLKKRRRIEEAVVELAVLGGVEDVADIVIRAETMNGGERVRLLFER